MTRARRHAHGLSACLLLATASGCAARARGTAAPATAHTASAPDDALDLHIKALSTQLRLEGLTVGALRERGFLPPSGRATYPVHIAAGECGLFVALATASMADLDASLYTPDGAPLIEDDSTGSRPSLTFCASAGAPVDAYLTLHAYQGAGSFVAAQFARPLRPDDDLHTAVGEGGGASALGQLAQTLHERGFEDVAPRVSVSVGTGPVRMAVHVVAGECYTLAAEAGAGLSELGLRLVDAEGGELANGVGEPALAALQYCASDRAELSLELTARRGQGVAQVARFRATQAVAGGVRALWLGEPSPSPAAWSESRSAASKNVDKVSAPSVSERVPLRQGEVFELASKPMHAACEIWQAQLAPGLSRVTLRVESDRGELLAEADSEHMSACLIICNANAPHRVTLLGRTGFGSALLTGSPTVMRVPETAARASARNASGTEGQADLVFLPPTCHGSSARLEGR